MSNINFKTTLWGVKDNKAIYDQAAERIADYFFDAYGSAYDKDMDCFTTSEKGYLIDEVVANIATIDEDFPIDYDYIWDTAYKMYQDMMAEYDTYDQVAEMVAKYYFEDDYAMDEHYGSAEMELMSNLAGGSFVDYDYVWDKAFEINHSLMAYTSSDDEDVEKYNYWYNKLYPEDCLIN